MRLENVAGTWSCPRVDGVCADIAAIDRSVTLETGPLPIRGPATPSSPFVTVGLEQDGMALTRTGDEVARIVLAPMIDAHGHYHASRVIYAVMSTGGWARTPVAAPAPTSIAASEPLPTDPRTRLASEGGDHDD
jgi:hypothetical protein